MAFPIVNAHVNSMEIGGILAGAATPLYKLFTSAIGYTIMDTPAVVDVSGMEFGMGITADSGSTAGRPTTASGASTLEFVFSSLGTTGTTAPSDNPLVTGDAFSNTLAGGWTTNLWRKSDGNTTGADLAAGDVIGLHVVANLTSPAGVGVALVQVAYIYGAPGEIN
jgi:hypothetical protein